VQLCLTFLVSVYFILSPGIEMYVDPAASSLVKAVQDLHRHVGCLQMLNESLILIRIQINFLSGLIATSSEERRGVMIPLMNSLAKHEETTLESLRVRSSLIGNTGEIVDNAFDILCSKFGFMGPLSFYNYLAINDAGSVGSLHQRLPSVYPCYTDISVFRTTSVSPAEPVFE
jgi:hypothetical protein